jgi:hypothetical protein
VAKPGCTPPSSRQESRALVGEGAPDTDVVVDDRLRSVTAMGIERFDGGNQIPDEPGTPTVGDGLRQEQILATGTPRGKEKTSSIGC